MNDPRVLAGHWIGGVLVPFPHVCPGDHCAIWRWLAKRERHAKQIGETWIRHGRDERREAEAG